MSSLFFCTDCGYESTKWMGRCPGCGSWNTFREAERAKTKKQGAVQHGLIAKAAPTPQPLPSIVSKNEERWQSSIKEFDGVLGGGIVPGMVTLIGGEPGIGKSTLMLQLSAWLATEGRKVLYCSGEESPQQIKIRSQRLQINTDNILLLCSINTDDILQALDDPPDLLVIDSIQAMLSPQSDSPPGSVSQLRECTMLFTRIAKEKHIPTFLIGHVTKDGLVAGPKIIEHIVDTVLYFEGEQQYKILRATKNRFGSTNEIGIFEMVDTGLQEVSNPSQLFIGHEESQVGSAIGCVVEGTRAFLLEVQALVTTANYGTSQRVAIGFDQRKLALLLAVIEKHLALTLRQSDIFLNLTGGMKTNEPCLDLAVIAAVLSSLKDVALPPKTVWLGEVGLSGEIRPVAQLDKRINEAMKLGYERIILSARHPINKKNAKLIPVQNITDIRKFIR